MDDSDWLTQRFEQQPPAAAGGCLSDAGLAGGSRRRCAGRLASAEQVRGADREPGWMADHRRCPRVPACAAFPSASAGGPRWRGPARSDSCARQRCRPQEVLLADSVGLALLVVLEHLSPAERLAFVLHDMFDLPLEEISGLIGRSTGATRQLASRARRHVRGAQVPAPDPDLRRQRQVVDAFFAAGRAGDFAELVKLLDPDVVLRADFGGGRPPAVFSGVAAVAKLAREPRGAQVLPVLFNGTVRRVVTIDGRPHSVLAVEIDSIGDPERVTRIAAAVLTGS